MVNCSDIINFVEVIIMHDCINSLLEKVYFNVCISCFDKPGWYCIANVLAIYTIVCLIG